MSDSIVDRHPAVQDRIGRRTHGRLILAGSAAMAIVISLAAFLLIGYYVL